jgi:hypothetical protein
MIDCREGTPKLVSKTQVRLHFRKSNLILVSVCLMALTACSSSFGGGPRDIRVSSVTEVDLKDQSQFEWAAPAPRSSKLISRIDFTTSTDLLALAKKKDYNVTFVVGQCTKDGVKDNGTSLGGVYWGKGRIYSDAKAPPGYAEAVAKGPPFTYQAYASQLHTHAAQTPMCFTLTGGSMLGNKLRSNVVPLPP